MGTFDRTPYINQFETFMSESLSRADGYNPEVRLAYRNYLNGAMPQRIESFRNMVEKKERDFYASKAKVESGRMLENGNFLGYEALQRSQLDAGNIEQPEYDYLIGGMQVDSLLMQADRSMDMEDPSNALVALNQIDIKSLDDPRREKYKALQATAREQKKVDTDNLQSEVLTSLFEHRNDSPVDRLRIGNDLAEKLKDSGIEPTRYSTLLTSIANFQDKPETLNHDPVLSGRLQADAENAESLEDKNKVLAESMSAYKAGKIKETELGAISSSVEKSYDTAIGRQKQSLVDDFRYITTKGYSTNDLEGWMKAQVISARASGATIDTGELINRWTRAAQARQWIVNEYNDMLDEQIDKVAKEKGRELTSKEIRIIGLGIQRFWYRKSDTQLVDLYDQWLAK